MDSVVDAIVADAFPDTHATGVTPTRSGNNKQTVVATLADGREVVIQYRELGYGSLEPEGEVTRVVRAETDVPVPRVLACGELDNHSYVVTALVDGTNLHHEFEALSLADRRSVAAALGRYLGTIHETFTFDGYGAITVDDDRLHVESPTRDWRSWLRRYLDDGLAAFQPPLTDLVDPIRDAVHTGIDRLPDQPTPRFYPWDYRPGNVLVAGPQGPTIAAVIDWGDPLAAHRELSIANTEYLVADWYADPAAADELRAAYHDGYRATATIPEEYFEARRRIYRLTAITRSAYDSQGLVTRPRYPMVDDDAAAAFHRTHLESLL